MAANSNAPGLGAARGAMEARDADASLPRPASPQSPLALAVPAKHRTLYQRALAGELSPRQAIRCKCLECVGWHRFESGEDLIGDCRVRACPLWAYRPYQRPSRMARLAAEPSEGSTSGAEVAGDEAKAGGIS